MKIISKKQRRLFMSFIKQLYVWTPSLILVLCIAIMPSVSAAETSKEVRELKEKVKMMEQRQSELYHSLEEKKAVGLMKKIAEKLTLGGLVEIEASRDENDKTGDTSDIVLATVQLGLDAEINERVTAHIQLLWEEDDTEPIDMDEGTITYQAPGNLSVIAGKMYIPFGVFNSHFISDPIVLELGETNETAAMVNYVEGPAEVSIGVFNGSVDDGGDDQIQDYFANVTVSLKGIVPLLDVADLGAYYTSNIGDSDTMTATIGTTSVQETIPAFGGFIEASYGPYSLYAEYIRAKEEFEVADLDVNGDGKGDKPEAFNIEAGYQLNPYTELAIKYEGNKEMFNFPERQYGVALSYGLFYNVTAKVEALNGDYEDGNTRTLFTGQVAVEF
jgi:hypothetical protein